MKKLLICFWMLISILSYSSLFAQEKGKASFEKKSHDFGVIKEEVGPAVVEFKFKNDGKVPISLTNVKASCGCTTPSWTKEPVKPGEEGIITASYNPKGRQGKFNKSITVRTDGVPEVLVLRISGDVTPRPKGPADFYPMEVGNLRFKTTHLAFGDVKNDGKGEASTIIYNQGDKPVTIDIAATKLPKFLTMKVENTTIAPKMTTNLNFTYDASLKKDWGYVFDHFKLITNDEEKAEKRINVSVDIKENFDHLEAGAKTPTVKFDKTSHHFGTMKQHSTVSTSFTIMNEGTAPLIIRKTKASCGCTASKPKKTTLQPGEATAIDVSFNSGTKTKHQKKSITVICNDPAVPETKLWIEVDIEETEK